MMPNRTTMNISLPEAMRTWVESRVRTGEYANASDYIRDLIRHDQNQHKERLDAETISAIRQGIADMRAGRVKPAEDIFSQIEAKYSEL